MTRGALDEGLLQEAVGMREDLVAIRRAIHAQPEFGFEEHQTAALVAAKMQTLGARVRIGVARTGVVAELGEGSPIVASAPIWTPCRSPRRLACPSPRARRA